MRLNTRAIVEAGVMIALATVLSFIKVYQAPQGGSVTAGSMIPVLAVALRWGPRAGILTGIAYGFVQQLVEPFVVHPVQALLDYPVAFGMLGIAGFFQKRPLLGVVLSIAGRFLSHVISGVVFFASFAPKGTPALTYSLAYNGSYLIPEVLISAVAVYILSTTRVLTRGNRDYRG